MKQMKMKPLVERTLLIKYKHSLFEGLGTTANFAPKTQIYAYSRKYLSQINGIRTFQLSLSRNQIGPLAHCL